MDNNPKEIIETAAGILYDEKLIELKDMQNMLRYARKKSMNADKVPAGFCDGAKKKESGRGAEDGIRVHL